MKIVYGMASTVASPNPDTTRVFLSAMVDMHTATLHQWIFALRQALSDPQDTYTDDMLAAALIVKIGGLIMSGPPPARMERYIKEVLRDAVRNSN